MQANVPYDFCLCQIIFIIRVYNFAEKSYISTYFNKLKVNFRARARHLKYH